MSTVVRELDLESLKLESGSHSDQTAMCVMEAVAYVAGEPWSDHPQCVCPIIASFLRRWNDDLDDAGRQRLKPYIARVIETRRSAAVEDRRGWMAADWMLRVHLPAWLELGGLKDQADAIRAMPAIDASGPLEAIQPLLKDARKQSAAARAAAWAAAGAAAGAAAWAAAWEKLKPAVTSLQDSAFELLDRLIAAEATDAVSLA